MGLRSLKSKRAISPVIATLLMINIALVLGVLVYAWASGLFGAWLAGSETYLQSRGEAMEEAIALENLRFDPDAAYKFNLTVRNVGKRDVWIAAVYLNGTNVVPHVDLAWNSLGEIVAVESGGLHAGTYHLLVGDSVTFAFAEAPISFEEGDLLSVVVATDRGTRVAQYWEASG